MIDRKLIDDCVHCGFCLPACPTYQSWHQEMDSPRGRIYLMKSLIEGKQEFSDAIIEHFDRCLGCMACVTACPSGVKYDELILQTRVAVEETRRRSLSDRMFRAMIFALLPYPKRLRLTLLARWLRPVGRVLPPRLRNLLSLMPLIRPSATFSPSNGEKALKRARVALLLGCVQRVYFPQINEATVRVLNAEGCDVVIPPDLGCCGALSAHAGREAEAMRFKGAAIDAIERAGVEAVVVNAAGCGSWMKEWRTGIPVKDVSEFLIELGPVATRHPLDLKVAYHDACHLAHAQRIRSQPRTLLRAIPGLQLVEIADGDQCCGSAGIYNLVEPESAREIGLRKVDNVLAADAEVLVSANPGCTLQIEKILRERGASMRTAHVIELLDASIRG